MHKIFPEYLTNKSFHLSADVTNVPLVLNDEETFPTARDVASEHVRPRTEPNPDPLTGCQNPVYWEVLLAAKQTTQNT